MGREMMMDTMFELFFEEGEWGGSSDGSCGRGCDPDGAAAAFDSDEDEMTASGGGVAERKAFWETQHHLLQEALSRTSSMETKIRRRTEVVAEKMRSLGVVCDCSGRRMEADCRNCELSHVAGKLQEAGYNSALCKSKWKSSPDVPSGEHSYIDVVMEGKSGQKGPIRVVIELNFRAEFEMARGSQEYNSLVSRLPEVFVGKAEKLKGVIKIMCAAAKKCMKDNKMHMAPWRKHKYMQSKWLGTPERIVPWSFSAPTTATAVAAGASAGQPKFRASMLTFDLHRTAVEVV